MGVAKRRSELQKSMALSNRFMHLNNKMSEGTFPVSVDHTFLTDIFNLEKSYDSDSVILFRRNSHPLRKFHVTGATIRLVMAISRRFNTEGTLVGCNTHRLYELMNEEYEDGCTKEQFYAEIHKFIELGILKVSRDGIVNEWKLNSFKRNSGRFVLFSPLVFMKSFTDLPIAAQKLYLYIVSRNGEKVGAEFKEFFGKNSWLYTLTHKSRPAQIRELFDSISAVEPAEGQPLFLRSSVERDSLGRWSVRCVLNPVYLVRHVPGAHYRMIPKAKIPYSKTVSRLRMLFQYHKISEIEQFDNGRVFLKLSQLLHNASLRTLRFVAARLRESLQRHGYLQPFDLVHSIQTELQDRSYVSFMEIAKQTGVYPYLGGMREDGYDDARPLQFFRAIKDKFTIKEFRRICCKAAAILRTRYGERFKHDLSLRPIHTGDPIHNETFYLEDFLIDLKNGSGRQGTVRLAP